jgi:glutamyl-tRNA synthetase
MLAMLGWNDGSGQEIFTLDELINKFSMDRVHKGGAKFDYEKAKWYNHEWIKKSEVPAYVKQVKKLFQEKNIVINDEQKFEKVLSLVKERCTLLPDFVQQASFFFQPPVDIDTNAIKPKWDEKKNLFFNELILALELSTFWQHEELEKQFKEMAAAHQIKPGDLMLPFRIMLVGGKFGPGVFDIAEIIGKDETIRRIKHTLSLLM